MINGFIRGLKKNIIDTCGLSSSLFSKITLLFVVGLAVSLIVSALSGFELGGRVYDVIVSDSVCPTLNTKNLFEYISSILEYTLSDIVLVVVVAIGGISFIGNSLYYLVSLLSGYFLGYGVISTITQLSTIDSDAKQTSVSIILSLVFYSAFKLIVPIFLSILSKDSGKISKLYKSGEQSWVFTKEFYHYITTLLIFLGSSLLLRMALSLLLKLLTVV